jgi:hypothetical protein
VQSNRLIRPNNRSLAIDWFGMCNEALNENFKCPFLHEDFLRHHLLLPGNLTG